MGKSYKKLSLKVILLVLILAVGYLFKGEEIIDLINTNDNSNDVTSGDMLYVHFIDVGQGDSILIEYNDYHILIDAGENDQGNVVNNYLHAQEVDDIEILVATHADSDHIGGLDTVLNEFEVERIIDSGYVHTTRTYQDYWEAVQEEIEDDSELIYDSDLTYTIAENITFEVMEVGDDWGTDVNEYSVITKLSYNDIDFLFTGDAAQEVEELLFDRDIEAEVFKAGHHGSKHSNGVEFLEKVDPEYVIISAGEDNKYGHPHDEAMNAFQHVEASIYLTSDSGSIVVSTDGVTLNVNADQTDYEFVDKSESENMSFVDFQDPMYKGEDVTVEIQGEANTDYEITVYLPSGSISKAGELDDNKRKTSDESGKVAWTWRMSSNANAGTGTVIVENPETGEKIIKYYGLESMDE